MSATYRALAECLIGTGNVDAAMLVYELALRGEWDQRFGAFRLITAVDYLRLLRRIESRDLATRLPELADDARERIASRYVSELPDVAIVLTWNTDRTDIDLHVVDPTGFECSYSAPRSPIGGGITTDVTTGYGPEMFMLGDAPLGEYVVKTNYFSSDGLRTTLRTRCYVTIAHQLGKPEESVTRTAFLLDDAKNSEGMLEIGRFIWK